MFVYKITNKINNEKYIGQTIQEPEKRWRRHVLNVGNKNIKPTPLTNAMRKYGIDSFVFEIIDNTNDINDLNKKEIEYITLFESLTTQKGYNVEIGGKNSLKTEEHKIKISKSKIGKKRGCFSKEWKENISKALKGRVFSKEHRDKISKANKLRKGNNITFISDEQRNKMIRGLKSKCCKKIICIETGVTYGSIREAAVELKLNPSNICAVLKGKLKTTGKFSFKYQ